MASAAEQEQQATRALIRFASEMEARPAVFDCANVSRAALGQETDGAAWWDASRGGVDLHGRDLSGASLRRADLSASNLAGAQLTGAKAAGLVLIHASIEGADFSEADLIGANLESVSAGEANFSEALLEDAHLHHAQLRFANFTDVIMDGADLSDADLWGARLDKAAAERGNFSGSRLDESSMQGAELNSADFTGASLRRANLSGARLRGATLQEANLDGAVLAGVDLSGASLPNLSLANCDLTHARFAGAWMERTRMRAQQLGGQVGEEAAGDLEGAVESYIVLERNFLSLGSSEDSSWAYRRRRRMGKALHRRQALSAAKSKTWGKAVISGTQWVGDASAEWLCDYGESLGRVARAFFTILVCFALLYWLTGSLTPRDGFTAHQAFNPINYVLFSLDSMTTVGTSEVALKPAGELGILLSSLQTVFGTVLLGLFGFVLGARIRS